MSAPAAVEGVKVGIRLAHAITIAVRRAGATRAAHSLIAVWARTATDDSAGTAVVGVNVQEGTDPVAIDGISIDCP